MRKTVLIGLFLILSFALDASDERNYGCISGIAPHNLIFQFQLVDPNNPENYISSDPGFATGDCRIRRATPGASTWQAWTACANTPVYDGEGGAAVTMTTTEMTAPQVIIKLVDLSATKLWADTAHHVVLGGAQNAMFFSATAPSCP